MAGAEVVLADIAARYLSALEPMSNGDLQCEDPNAVPVKSVWRLITPQIWLKNHNFDELSKVLETAVEHARSRAASAERTNEAWNRAGLLPEDELTTDEEEGELLDASSTGAENASNLLRQQISEYQHQIARLEV